MATGKVSVVGLGVTLIAMALAVAQAQQVDLDRHNLHRQHVSAVSDGRQLVIYPEEMRQQTLVNMRDHLLALQQIQEALGQDKFDAAGDIAEDRLGMTSLRLHGAHDVAKYMPPGMRDIGSRMHQAASQFALAAKDAGATGDIKPALSAYSRTMQQCVACHSTYRLH